MAFNKQRRTMSRDIYFDNGNIPPGHEDDGLRPEKTIGKDFNKKQTQEDRQKEHDAWREFPERKEHYE